MDPIVSMAAGGACSALVNFASEPGDRMYRLRIIDIIKPGLPRGAGEYVMERLKTEGVGAVLPNWRQFVRRSRVARDGLAFGVRDLAHSGLGKRHIRSETSPAVRNNFVAGAVAGAACGVVTAGQHPLLGKVPLLQLYRTTSPSAVMYFSGFFGVFHSMTDLWEWFNTRAYRQSVAFEPFDPRIMVSSVVASTIATFASQPLRVAAHHFYNQNHRLPTGSMKYLSLPHTIAMLRYHHGTHSLLRGIGLDKICYSAALLVLTDAVKKATADAIPRESAERHF